MKNNRLKGRIVERYGTASNFAKAMGINQAMISNLLNGKTEWKVGRMAAAIELLGIPKEEFDIYFLPGCLAVGNSSKDDD